MNPDNEITLRTVIKLIEKNASMASALRTIRTVAQGTNYSPDVIANIVTDALQSNVDAPQIYAFLKD